MSEDRYQSVSFDPTEAGLRIRYVNRPTLPYDYEVCVEVRADGLVLLCGAASDLPLLPEAARCLARKLDKAADQAAAAALGEITNGREA